MSKHAQFEKFIKKKKPSVLKEELKQEKKAYKKERSAAIEQRFEEKRRLRSDGQPGNAAKGGTGAASRQQKPVSASENTPAESMPLNKYIAHSGVCARRDAAELVRKGEVTVNGKVVTEPGTKVTAADLVKVKDKKIIPSRHFVYILLNKPKDYLTTTEDPQGRKTVLDLIRHATQERVYPIGRLDRNTSGVLLFTNDGELAQSLSHPKNEVKKIYEIKLDKPWQQMILKRSQKALCWKTALLHGCTCLCGCKRQNSDRHRDPQRAQPHRTAHL